MTPDHMFIDFQITPCRRWRRCLAGVFLGLLVFGTSHASPALASQPSVIAAPDAGRAKESRMWMTVGDRRFAVTLAGNDAARVFASRLPLTLDMTDLNGNEKKFDLPDALPAKPSRPGTIRNGDLMLYGVNTLVVFYLTFDSPYSYTRLGRIDDPGGLAQALGRGNVRVTFSIP